MPVIELLVAVGDTVKQDQGLVTLESDKATMEVPAPFAGVVRELKVKLGDKLSRRQRGGADRSQRAAPRAAAADSREAPQPRRRRDAAPTLAARRNRRQGRTGRSAAQPDRIAQQPSTARDAAALDDRPGIDAGSRRRRARRRSRSTPTR